MTRALRLARRGQYSAHPNPMVGCVIVNGGDVVGEGWHAAAGKAHAEINALEAAGDRAKGGTAYVTLEPCSHHGKTPPCADALIVAGISEVVAAIEDPNPKVAGDGFHALEKAGITVRRGIRSAAARELIRGFAKRVVEGIPFVTLKIAASLDGCIAMANGQSQWITGTEARTDVQKFRARSGAIMSGIGTVLVDDPSLTVRDTSLETHGEQPLRVILDKELRMPLSAEMLALPGSTLLYCVNDSNRDALVQAGAEVVRVDEQDGQVSIAAVLRDLASREINDVLVEAGPTLAGGLLEAEYVDELVIYQAPHIMGSETMRMFRTPHWTELGDRLELNIIEVAQIGDDTRIVARPKN
ncbi:MAG: bifunctional diaminohydroxyphosphoribosylaminopyrimidine deaminase/5-amino-6-(5-phosphoribosylamino)uracil reductase RibD [Woeseiaceae bacterium]|nr:bifunctional diaminohydroxyphosphoribosylaminopyrimidine deaminase/5-amino-6-(5-phosphoribosylamino)uracil reductase RibD [Woeseiaceae bacterium]